MTDRFTITDTPLGPVKLVERRRMGDERGFLSRLYCRDELDALGMGGVAQINHTLTRRRGAVRGLHFQHAPHAEGKLVSVLRGEVFDVAVDLRAGSPTFRRWHGATLSGDNRRALWIPPGFAHGFQTLSDDCELIYLHTAAYRGSAEGGIDPFDPLVGIAWPLAATDLSARDRGHPPLTAAFAGITP